MAAQLASLAGRNERFGKGEGFGIVGSAMDVVGAEEVEVELDEMVAVREARRVL